MNAVKSRFAWCSMVGVFFLILCVHSFSFAMPPVEEDGLDQEIRQVIEDYYAYCYDSINRWATGELPDLSAYMDMDQVQCQNVRKYLVGCIFNRRVLAEVLGEKPHDEMHPYHIEFVAIDLVQPNEVIVEIRLETDERQAYPLFMLRGENKFKLRFNGEKWRITEWSAGKNTDTELFQTWFSTVELNPLKYSDETIWVRSGT